jgi:hypothetical protein
MDPRDPPPMPPSDPAPPTPPVAPAAASEDIPQFLDALTPVRLRYDTRVTNHGFRDGEARPFQAILQAGTAVLVDRHGVPRNRCSCGNPLTEPSSIDSDAGVDQAEALDLQHLAANPDDAWDDLDANQVVTVEPGDERDPIVVADLQTGQHVEQLPGITYTIEQLQAALPTQDEDHETYESFETCAPGGSPCTGSEPGREEVGIEARGEAPEGAQGGGYALYVSGIVWTDVAVRSQWLDVVRSGDEELSGRIDTPAVDNGGGTYSPGSAGRGPSRTSSPGDGREASTSRPTCSSTSTARAAPPSPRRASAPPGATPA